MQASVLCWAALSAMACLQGLEGTGRGSVGNKTWSIFVAGLLGQSQLPLPCFWGLSGRMHRQAHDVWRGTAYKGTIAGLTAFGTHCIWGKRVYAQQLGSVTVLVFARAGACQL
jgi:hypothetical protein|mmetsp:Transcript_9845/g.16609  ORF Transcript_9845/g.16609 Transcript_9845/m.16609 type:complete len:113 (+) Transcript_9845:166-504(+)